MKRPQVEHLLNIDVLLDAARDGIVDMHISDPGDDALDYMKAAAWTYDTLVDIKRATYGCEPDVVTAAIGEWLDEPFDMWLATDGDMRWYLSQWLTGSQATAWDEYTEGAL